MRRARTAKPATAPTAELLCAELVETCTRSVGEQLAAELVEIETRISCLTKSPETIRGFLVQTEHSLVLEPSA